MRPSFALALALSLVALPLRAQVPAQEYADRRARLVEGMEDGIFLALGSGEPPHDYQTFEQNPDFFYLTGIREPDAALVVVRRGAERTTMLFVQPRDPAREVWTGARMGTAGATERTGIPAREDRQLRAVLDSLLGLGMPLVVAGELEGSGTARTPHAQFVQALRQKYPSLKVSAATQAIARLRGTKSAAELELIRKAVTITVAAQQEAMRAVEPGMNEFELQALIEYTFRRNGADRPSFATIVGSGPNATTLHYNADDRFVQAGEMIVMDIGASYRGYAADVTRSVPANGTYSPAQRDVYRVVREAQAAAERQATPGAKAQQMSDSAVAVISAGLARLGLIESPTATYDCVVAPEEPRECPQYRLYYMHGLGHGIGLEVHDPDQFYFTGTLAPGSAFTIEPGIYVRANLLDVIPDSPRNRALKARVRAAVAKYANVGVRIEDDYLMTATGLEWISRAPREMEEIEALMRQPFAGPAPRDTAKVDWYKAGAK